MFEKVNPAHPDKIADRIAGALVDLAYKHVSDPKIAVEVLIGHGECHIISVGGFYRRKSRFAFLIFLCYNYHKEVILWQGHAFIDMLTIQRMLLSMSELSIRVV